MWAKSRLSARIPRRKRPTLGAAPGTCTEPRRSERSPQRRRDGLCKSQWWSGMRMARSEGNPGASLQLVRELPVRGVGWGSWPSWRPKRAKCWQRCHPFSAAHSVATGVKTIFLTSPELFWVANVGCRGLHPLSRDVSAAASDVEGRYPPRQNPQRHATVSIYMGDCVVEILMHGYICCLSENI